MSNHNSWTSGPICLKFWLRNSVEQRECSWFKNSKLTFIRKTWFLAKVWFQSLYMYKVVISVLLFWCLFVCLFVCPITTNWVSPPEYILLINTFLMNFRGFHHYVFNILYRVIFKWEPFAEIVLVEMVSIWYIYTGNCIYLCLEFYISMLWILYNYDGNSMFLCWEMYLSMLGIVYNYARNSIYLWWK